MNQGHSDGAAACNVAMLLLLFSDGVAACNATALLL